MPCGKNATAPGYAACPRGAGHDGPCAHPMAPKIVALVNEATDAGERERAATLDRNRLATAAREALLLVDDTIAALQALFDNARHCGLHPIDVDDARKALRMTAARRAAIVARMLAPVSDGR